MTVTIDAKHGTFTVKDGTKLHYMETGTGTPVILIHGAGSRAERWFLNGIAEALAKTNRVIAIDMRAHGRSEPGPEGSRGSMAADVVEFMSQLGIEKAHIGGYSMGGMITGQLLATNPEKFITAHFGGSGIRETQEWADKVPPDKEGTAPDEEAARAARAPSATDTQRAPRPQADAAPDAARRAASGPAVDLASIKFPVLAVNGEYDRPNSKTHRLWRELDNFTNVVLPGKGHLSAVVEGFIPQRYIDCLVTHITTNNPR